MRFVRADGVVARPLAVVQALAQGEGPVVDGGSDRHARIYYPAMRRAAAVASPPARRDDRRVARPDGAGCRGRRPSSFGPHGCSTAVAGRRSNRRPWSSAAIESPQSAPAPLPRTMRGSSTWDRRDAAAGTDRPAHAPDEHGRPLGRRAREDNARRSGAAWRAKRARHLDRQASRRCRDMGPTWPYVDVDLRNAIDEGVVPGPRMMVAGNYVSATGGAGDARQFSIYVDVPLVKNLADGPDDIRKAVRTNLKNGADFIKILATGAVLSKGTPPGAQQYTEDRDYGWRSRKRARWGRHVAAHAHGTDGIKAAIRAGVQHGRSRQHDGRRSGGTAPLAPRLLRADALHERVHRGEPTPCHQQRRRARGRWRRSRTARSRWCSPPASRSASRPTRRWSRTERTRASLRTACASGKPPMACDRVGNEDERRDHGLERPRRHRRAGSVRRSDRCRRRSAAGHHGVAARWLGDEGRHGLPG